MQRATSKPLKSTPKSQGVDTQPDVCNPSRLKEAADSLDTILCLASSYSSSREERQRRTVEKEPLSPHARGPHSAHRHTPRGDDVQQLLVGPAPRGVTRARRRERARGVAHVRVLLGDLRARVARIQQIRARVPRVPGAAEGRLVLTVRLSFVCTKGVVFGVCVCDRLSLSTGVH